MKHGFLFVVSAVLLTGCAQGALVDKPRAETELPEDAQTRPQARPAALNTQIKRPPKAARTVEEFDTTTSAQREQAVAAAAQAPTSRPLGTSIASLGDPARPGFWLETPLVSDAGTGKVRYPANGKTVQVELIPIDGPKTAGSRISLAAMRLIEAPLTGLPEIEVFQE